MSSDQVNSYLRSYRHISAGRPQGPQVGAESRDSTVAAQSLVGFPCNPWWGRAATLVGFSCSSGGGVPLQGLVGEGGVPLQGKWGRSGPASGIGSPWACWGAGRTRTGHEEQSHRRALPAYFECCAPSCLSQPTPIEILSKKILRALKAVAPSGEEPARLRRGASSLRETTLMAI